jgi:hypothetical protein
MRRFLLLFIMTTAFVGCSALRDSQDVVPDRGGHAYNPDAPAGAPGVDAPVRLSRSAGAGTVTVLAGERLYQIAEREGVELWALIERNDLVEPVRAGERLELP